VYICHSSRESSSYRKTRSIGPLHTGGPVVATSDAKRLVTCLGDQAILTNVESGEEICRFASVRRLDLVAFSPILTRCYCQDTTAITAIALAPSENELVVISASLSMRIYAFPSLYSSPMSKPLEPSRHMPKSHDAPVHVVTVDPTSSYIATGSADGVAKVWDMKRGYVTHAFKAHGGVISCLRFHFPSVPSHQEDANSPPSIWLVTGSIDTRIRIFDLVKSNVRSANAKPFAVLDGHVSVPRGIDFSADGKWMLTAGRDSVVLVWQLQPPAVKVASKKGIGENMLTPTLAKTIPVLEAVEALAVIKPISPLTGKSAGEPLHFFIAGEKGAVHIWDAHRGTLLRTFQERREDQSMDAEELRSIREAMCVYRQNRKIVSNPFRYLDIAMQPLQLWRYMPTITSYSMPCSRFRPLVIS